MNITTYIKYDEVTGQVMGGGFTNIESPEVNILPGLKVLLNEEVDADKEYVNTRTGKIKKRPSANNIKNVISVRPLKRGEVKKAENEARINGISKGATVSIINAKGETISTTIDDGELILTFEEKGKHTFILRSFPEQDEEITIDVT